MLQCPVCLEDTDRPQFPFECGHALCRNCSRRMSQSDLHRCPTCRAPREGMTAEQAAPQQEDVGEARPYAGLFRLVSHHAMPQAASIPLPDHEMAPLSADFAVALLMLERERQSRQPLTPIDLSQLDDETRGDLEALGDMSVSITEWQRRRREQAERRRALELAQD